jgi:hypothetical protein
MAPRGSYKSRRFAGTCRLHLTYCYMHLLLGNRPSTDPPRQARFHGDEATIYYILYSTVTGRLSAGGEKLVGEVVVRQTRFRLLSSTTQQSGVSWLERTVFPIWSAPEASLSTRPRARKEVLYRAQKSSYCSTSGRSQWKWRAKIKCLTSDRVSDNCGRRIVIYCKWL